MVGMKGLAPPRLIAFAGFLSNNLVSAHSNTKLVPATGVAPVRLSVFETLESAILA